MNLTIPVYEQRQGKRLEWTTLALGPLSASRHGRNAMKIQQALVGDLKRLMHKVEAAELDWLQFPARLRLERVRLDLTLKGSRGKRKVTGRFPLIVEPRWVGEDRRIHLVYHPLRQEEWFPLELEQEQELEQRAVLYLQRVWAELSDDEIDELQTSGKDRVKVFSFSASLPSLLDRLPRGKKGVWDDLQPDLFKQGKNKPQGMKVLKELGVDQTQHAAELSLPLGMPRSPQREQLQMLLGGQERRSTLVVGPPQSGKTTIIHCLINDLLLAQGYEVHRNLDRVHHVWKLSGQRIIAGMSYLGDWEQRCIDLLQDATQHRVVLWLEDIAAMGRLGRTRDSDRNLAEFFRGPVARGDVTLVGECTPEQLQQLEQDAPSFAALLSRVHVAGTGVAQTLRMMLHEARELELREEVQFEPTLLREVIEATGSLMPRLAFPGKALELLRGLARALSGAKTAKQTGPVSIGSSELLELLSRRTGLPEALLRLDQPLDARGLRQRFEERVMGQPEAVEVACDLVLRIRAGLTDPSRPYAVLLFAGPTGVGKTELAKAIAQYLYGDVGRLIRVDMGEFGDGGAAARLVGDQFEPRGLLTDPVRQQPFCVVLLDEIEKAHPAVLNLLLQLFDEGRLTDAAGDAADFTHAAVIMTSNLGARMQAPIGFAEDPAAVVQETLRAVREFFAPELFNRMDRVVPFRPLDREVAVRIAAKEHARLLGRRGLTERNVLVYPSARVLDRIVEHGFDPLLGARPVKRYLEQQVGTLLAETISAGSPALMQILHLFTGARSSLARSGGAAPECGVERTRGRAQSAGATVTEPFQIHLERLSEAVPATDALPLEPLLTLPVRELQQLLPAQLDRLDQLLESDTLQQMTTQMRYHLTRHQQGDGVDADHADAAYQLDALRGELGRLRGRIGFMHARRTAERRELLRCLAEVCFIERTVHSVARPEQHAIFIELLHLGLGRRTPDIRDLGPSSLMQALTAAYLGREAWGELEQHAMRHADGRVTADAGPPAMAGPGPEQLVLQIVGLNVADFFGGEHGCHIWRSLTHGSDVLRVRVWAADAEQTPREVIADHLAQEAAFQQALEGGVRSGGASPGVRSRARGAGEPRSGAERSAQDVTARETDPCAQALPPNPNGLLPLCREYRFDPPTRPKATGELEITDHALGYVGVQRVHALDEGLARIWLLRMSRPPGGQ